MTDLKQATQQPEPIGTAGDLFTTAALMQFDLRPSTKVYITHPPEPQPDLQDLRYAAEKPLWDAALRQIDDDVFAAYAEPQPEPVAYYNFQTHKMRWAKPTVYAEIVAVNVPELPLYTHPPQRQPLSDTDILQGWKSATKVMGVPTDQVVLTFGRWLEAMHGIGGDK